MHKKPHSLFIEASGRCNAGCPYCPKGSGEQPQGTFMQPDEFFRLLKHLKERQMIPDSGEIVLYNWGEPFLNPGIEDILSIVGSFGCKASLSSNFLYLPKLSKKALSAVHHMIFSLSGFTQSSYKRIHGGNLSKTLHNFDRFQKQLSEFGIPCSIKVNWHRYVFNESELPSAIDYFQNRSVDFLPTVANFGGVARIVEFIDNNDYQKFYDRDIDRELFTEYMRSRLSECKRLGRYCPQWSTLTINEKCEVLLCCSWSEIAEGVKLGSAFDFPYEKLEVVKQQSNLCKECLDRGIAQYSAQYGSREDLASFQSYLSKKNPSVPIMQAGRSAPLTVCMTVFNEEKHMGDAVRSLLSQTHADFKLIIYNNGSTDASGSIADAFAAEDSRVTALHSAVNDSKNFYRLVENADTTYLMSAAGHDLYDPSFIEKCLGKLQNDPSAVLCYSRAVWFKDNQITGEIPGNFETKGMDPFSRAMVVAYGLVYAFQAYGIYRLDALKKVGRRKVVGFDHVMLAELATMGEFIQVNEHLFYMRQFDDFGSAAAYRNRHHSADSEAGVAPYLRTLSAYMKIADRAGDRIDRSLFKMAFFTECLLRNRNILSMFGESIPSLFARPGFSEALDTIEAFVKQMETGLLPRYMGEHPQDR